MLASAFALFRYVSVTFIVCNLMSGVHVTHIRFRKWVKRHEFVVARGVFRLEMSVIATRLSKTLRSVCDTVWYC
jgi:hypothetical protein